MSLRVNQLLLTSADGIDVVVDFPSERPVNLYFVAQGCRWCDASLPAARRLASVLNETELFLVIEKPPVDADDSADFRKTYEGLSATLDGHAGPFAGAAPVPVRGTPYLLRFAESGQVVGALAGSFEGMPIEAVLRVLGR